MIEILNGLIAQKQVEIGYNPEMNPKQHKILTEYFTHDENFLTREEGYSFDKGLLIIGNIGCGKTLMMKAFNKNPLVNYRVVNCRAIASDFAIGGDEAIEKYFNIQPANYMNKKPAIAAICFDDLGTEPDKKYFGMDVNVLLEVMLRRYDAGSFNRTHATTNLTPNEIRARYGDRLASRFREMFNLVKFPADAPDLRK